MDDTKTQVERLIEELENEAPGTGRYTRKKLLALSIIKSYGIENANDFDGTSLSRSKSVEDFAFIRFAMEAYQASCALDADDWNELIDHWGAMNRWLFQASTFWQGSMQASQLMDHIRGYMLAWMEEKESDRKCERQLAKKIKNKDAILDRVIKAVEKLR